MFSISREKAIGIRNDLLSLSIKSKEVPIIIALEITRIIQKNNGSSLPVNLPESLVLKISHHYPDIYNYLEPPVEDRENQATRRDLLGPEGYSSESDSEVIYRPCGLRKKS